MDVLLLVPAAVPMLVGVGTANAVDAQRQTVINASVIRANAQQPREERACAGLVLPGRSVPIKFFISFVCILKFKISVRVPSAIFISRLCDADCYAIPVPLSNFTKTVGCRLFVAGCRLQI